MNKNIVIGFAGDVMIGRLVNEHLAGVPSEYIWGDILPLLQTTDFNIINLEAALTTSDKEVPKVFNFKSDPVHVKTLIDASVDVVNLANNHVLDYSEEGLIETLKTLDKAGIKHVGAGKSLQEASEPVVVTVDGVRIGILGCTDNEPDWAAGPTKPGIRYIKVGDIKSIQPDIEKLRKQVDIVILSMHWGPNMVERPSREFIAFAHALIDGGVDIIHGHSAHIYQGVEVYKGKLILYDTGDFVDDYYVDPRLRNDRSFFFLVSVNKERVVLLRMIPVLISHFQVNRALGGNAKAAMERMQLLSAERGTKLKIAENELFLD